MADIFKEIFDWSESWAPLIPLAVMLTHRQESHYSRPIRVMVVISLFLYLVINMSWKLKNKLDWWFILDDNRILYNIASIVRTLCFCLFFVHLKLPFKGKFPWLLPSLYAMLLCWAVFRRGDWQNFSDFLHTTESILLIFYALSYYLRTLLSDQAQVLRTPVFWIVTGLVIYEAISLPIFMLYNQVAVTDANFAVDIWDIHNIAFLVMFICIAKGLKAPLPYGP